MTFNKSVYESFSWDKTPVKESFYEKTDMWIENKSFMWTTIFKQT